MANEKLIVELSAQIQGLKQGLDNASKEIAKFNTNTNKTTKNIDKDFNQIGASANQLGSVLAGAFAVGSLISFGRSVVETTSKFETMAAVLTNTLGSASQAQLAMNMITKFAAETPFSVEELTGAFVKLANQGFKPSYEEMRKLGDLASSTGKSFGQLAEAILDAQTGEFERLKEFGVKAKVAGDQVTFTFREVATTVKNTSSSIQQYLLGLGDIEGVSGAAAAISQTLQGKISNLGDAWTTFMKNLGDANTGPLKTTVTLLGDMLSKVNALMHGKNVVDELGIGKGSEQPLFGWMGKLSDLNLIVEGFKKLGGTLDSIDVVKIGKAYDALNNAISGTKSQEGLQNLINKFTEIKNGLDQTSPYFKVYEKAILNAKDAVIALTKEEAKAAAARAAAAAALAAPKIALSKRIAFKPTSMAEQAAVDYDVSDLYPVQAVTAYTSEMNLLNSASEKLFQITDEHYGKYQAIYIPTEEEKAAALERTNQVLTAQTMLVGALSSGFEQMFTTIIDGGQNAFQGILNALKSLMIKLAAAIAAAAVLFVLTGGLSSGGNALQKIGEIAKTMGGLGFNPFALGGSGTGSRIAMPSNTTAQGGYQIDIMGDKMRLLLNNEAIKNSRVV
jgi:hypothetical protein